MIRQSLYFDFNNFTFFTTHFPDACAASDIACRLEYNKIVSEAFAQLPGFAAARGPFARETKFGIVLLDKVAVKAVGQLMAVIVLRELLPLYLPAEHHHTP
jgi:hypothetical protein